MKKENFVVVPFSKLDDNLTAEHYINQMIKCSLCNQEFQKFDADIDARKEAHEKHHARRELSDNQIIGKVEWLDV